MLMEPELPELEAFGQKREAFDPQPKRLPKCPFGSSAVDLEVEASLEEGRRHVAPLSLITLSRFLSIHCPLLLLGT